MQMHLEMSSAKYRPSCLGLNVLTYLKYAVSARIEASFHFHAMKAMATIINLD